MLAGGPAVLREAWAQGCVVVGVLWLVKALHRVEDYSRAEDKVILML